MWGGGGGHVSVLRVCVVICLRCNGGFPAAAWSYFDRDGVVTGGQYRSKQVCLGQCWFRPVSVCMSASDCLHECQFGSVSAVKTSFPNKSPQCMFGSFVRDHPDQAEIIIMYSFMCCFSKLAHIAHYKAKIKHCQNKLLG